LIKLEGAETFAGLQRFIATVYRLTRERRLSRFVYLSRKPGEAFASGSAATGHSTGA